MRSTSNRDVQASRTNWREAEKVAVNAATEAHAGETPAITGDNNATEPVNTGVAEWSHFEDPFT